MQNDSPKEIKIGHKYRISLFFIFGGSDLDFCVKYSVGNRKLYSEFSEDYNYS